MEASQQIVLQSPARSARAFDVLRVVGAVGIVDVILWLDWSAFRDIAVLSIFTVSFLAVLLALVTVVKRRSKREATRQEMISLVIAFGALAGGQMLQAAHAVVPGRERLIRVALALLLWCLAIVQAYQAGRKSWQTKS